MDSNARTKILRAADRLDADPDDLVAAFQAGTLALGVDLHMSETMALSHAARQAAYSGFDTDSEEGGGAPEEEAPIDSREALISELTEVSAFDAELLEDEDDEFLETHASTLDISVATDALADQIAANLTGPVLDQVDERLAQLGTVRGQTNEFASQGADTDEIELGGLCAEFNDDGAADEGPVTPLSCELRESGDDGE